MVSLRGQEGGRTARPLLLHNFPSSDTESMVIFKDRGVLRTGVWGGGVKSIPLQISGRTPETNITPYVSYTKLK